MTIKRRRNGLSWVREHFALQKTQEVFLRNTAREQMSRDFSKIFYKSSIGEGKNSQITA